MLSGIVLRRSGDQPIELVQQPLLGAARISHATAPRNGGVTNEAVTSARIACFIGRSVRATSSPWARDHAAQGGGTPPR